MANTHTIHQLISDIQALRDLEDRHSSLAEVVAYLLANAPLIEACLNWVKENTSEDARNRLQAEHLTHLDGSGISDSFWEDIPYSALRSASRYYIGLTDEITDDELHMLRRGLDYASYYRTQSFRLLLSPVKR